MAKYIPPDDLIWPRDTQKHIRDRERAFGYHLNRVSECFARHGRVDSVSIRHVDDAHDALAKSGLSDVPWYKRKEFEVGAGAFCVGAAFAASDIVSVFGGDGVTGVAFKVGLFVAGIAISTV